MRSRPSLKDVDLELATPGRNNSFSFKETPEVQAAGKKTMGNSVLTHSDLLPGMQLSTLNAGRAVPDDSLLGRLGGNLRDAFFTKRQPPLQLASQPIAVADPLAVKRDPVASMISFVLHAAVFALILWFVYQAHQQLVAPKPVVSVPIYVKPYIPITMPVPKTMGGGGGGGAHQVVEANKGRLPPIAKTQIVPVETLKVDHPKLAAQPTIAMPQHVNIPVNAKMPMFGMTQSPQVAMASQGSGSGSGFGHGAGGGIGSGIGSGLGPGTGGGYGGGVMSVGGGVTAPQLIHSVDPNYSSAARAAKLEGAVSLRLIVDPQGNPVDIQVIRHLGMGLDEKALEAVRQYKFKPARYQGHPVPVQMVVQVNFTLN